MWFDSMLAAFGAWLVTNFAAEFENLGLQTEGRVQLTRKRSKDVADFGSLIAAGSSAQIEIETPVTQREAGRDVLAKAV